MNGCVTGEYVGQGSVGGDVKPQDMQDPSRPNEQGSKRPNFMKGCIAAFEPYNGWDYPFDEIKADESVKDLVDLPDVRDSRRGIRCKR